jgi:hypothetical protein
MPLALVQGEQVEASLAVIHDFHLVTHVTTLIDQLPRPV